MVKAQSKNGIKFRLASNADNVTQTAWVAVTVSYRCFVWPQAIWGLLCHRPVKFAFETESHPTEIGLLVTS